MKTGRRLASLILFIAGFFTCFTPPAIASPWPRGDGNIFISSRANYFTATGNFLRSTPDLAVDEFERFETDTYFEYGLTDKTTLGGKIVYGTSTLSNQFESITVSGLSETELYVQRQLWTGQKGVGAISIIGALPNRVETGLRPDASNDGAATELRFLYGYRLAERPRELYVGVETGYRKRFGDAADQGRIDITFGYQPMEKFLFLVQSFNNISVRNEQNNGTDFDVYKIAPSLVWRGGKRWSIQTGIIHEYTGRNLATGTTYFFGLWSEF